jgi:hypothetical protein
MTSCRTKGYVYFSRWFSFGRALRKSFSQGVSSAVMKPALSCCFPKAGTSHKPGHSGGSGWPVPGGQPRRVVDGETARPWVWN